MEKVPFSNSVSITSIDKVENIGYQVINSKYGIVSNIVVQQPEGGSFDFRVDIVRKNGLTVKLYGFTMDDGDVYTDHNERVLMNGDKLVLTGDVGVTMIVDGYILR